MGTWTVTTTADQDDAIEHAHAQSQKPPPGMVPGQQPPPVTTIEDFFEQQVLGSTVAPMVTQYQFVQNQELIATLATIPPENRAAAKADIEAVIKGQGGTVKIKSGTWLWSDQVTPPPPLESVTLDAAQNQPTEITMVLFADVDNADVNQRDGLLALTSGMQLKIEDPRQAGVYFMVFTTTGAPVGQAGYVEVPVRHYQTGGPLGAGWPMTCTFS